MDTQTENVSLNDALDTLEGLKNYRDWIIGEFYSFLTGHAVEIGAGSGSLSEKILEYVSKLDVIEPSVNLTSRLTARLGSKPNVMIHNLTSDEWLDNADPASRDTIIMVNVLEHIYDDQKTLQQIYNVLKPGASLLLYVPALPFLFSRLDEEHGHFRRYTKKALSKKVAHAGFEILQAKYIDLLGIIPWLIFNKWLGRTTFDKNMVHFYDRFCIPITKLVETSIMSPIGKNVALIARKPI